MSDRPTEEWLEDAKAWADLQAQHRAAFERRDFRLIVAWWLGDHLPLRWLPRFVNNRLARFMWDTLGFDYDPSADAR